MAQKKWYAHIQGENFGPLSETLIGLLIKENRLHFVDFIWAEGMKKWARVNEVAEFQHLVPPYPKTAVPDIHETVTPIHAGGKHVEAAGLTKLPPRPPLRRGERVDIEASITFNGKEKFKVLNISVSGVLVKLSKNASGIGEEVKFTLESKVFEKPLEMTGLVIREDISVSGSAFAIEFTRINPAHYRIIKSYTESHTPRE